MEDPDKFTLLLLQNKVGYFIDRYSECKERDISETITDINYTTNGVNLKRIEAITQQLDESEITKQ